MKLLFLLSVILMLFSCVPVSTVSEHSGSGEVDQSGRAMGNWTLFSDAHSRVFAKGAYLNGKPYGPWEVWDDAGVKNAELDFENGDYQGEYRLYYTGYTSEAIGALKTVGRIENGRYTGDFIRYGVNGGVLVSYRALNNVVTTVQEGLRHDAEEQLAADMALLKVYKEAILAAQYKRSTQDSTPEMDESYYR